jgi:hypothetical protein
MATTKQKSTARKNVRSATKAAKKRKTLTKSPKRTRTALGKPATKVKRQRRQSGG